MAYVSAKVLNEIINIDEVVEEARTTWEKRQRSRRRLEQWLVKALPAGLVVMSGIFYGLSAPHTAALLTLITPQIGPIAPLGFELGILTLSALREAGWKSHANVAMLLILLILSVVINVAGAFIGVVSAATDTSLASDTLPGLLSKYDTLPAIMQVVLALIAPVGAMIPVMAKLTGEAVMKLALGKVALETQSDDARWIQERPMIVHSALFQAATKTGAGAKTAGNWAAAVVKSLFREDILETGIAAVSDQRIVILEPSRSPMGFLRGIGQSGQSAPVLSVSENQQPLPIVPSKDRDSIRLSKKAIVEWLRDNPQVHHLHPKQMCEVYMETIHGFKSDSGYKTFERAIQELRR